MNNVFTSASPFLAILRLTGLFPMAFIGPARNGVLRFKWLDAILGILWLLIGLTSISLSTLKLRNIFLGQSKILGMAWYLMINCETLFYIGFQFHQVHKRKSILEILRQLCVVDSLVSIELWWVRRCFDNKTIQFSGKANQHNDRS